MYALFLETEAADEVRAYCAANPEHNVDEVLKSLYRNGLFGDTWGYKIKGLEDMTIDERSVHYDDWWVSRCLDDDKHKRTTVDSICTWDHTPEGQYFWAGVSGF
jgi:hypothetical protein